MSPLRTKFLSELSVTVVIPYSMQHPQHFEFTLFVMLKGPKGDLGGYRIFKNI